MAYTVRNYWYPHLVSVDISNTAAPIVVGQRTLPGAQYNLSLQGHYAYVASSSIWKEMQIIDIANPATLPVVANFDTRGPKPSLGIHAAGDYVYIVREWTPWNSFVIANIANPAAPVFMSTMAIGKGASDVVTLGNYSYVASFDSSHELQVIDVSNKSAPTLAKTIDFAGSSDATAIDGSGSILAVGLSDGRLMIMDITQPANPILKSTFECGDTVNDIVIARGGKYIFLVSSNAEKALQIIDISNLSAPSLIGYYTHVFKLHGLDYSESRNIVVAVGESKENEFLIIGPR
jgi:hypothetical protein